jgi:TP901 family phage tail tape measure protein
MAAEEKRTITIKINGVEVAASVKLVEKELAKARIELKNNEIGSAKYVAAMKRIGELSPVLNKHKADLKGVSTQGGFLKTAFGGIGSSISGMLGPLALFGAAFGALRDGINTSRQFETALKQLEVRTGITGENLKILAQGATELGTAYGEVPKEIVKAFAEAASARPELVGNTQALKDFTQQALILSKITGEEVNTSISNLSTIMNTNGLLTSQTADTVNILVGASQKGAKEIPFLSQAMEKIGGTAANANVSLSEQAAVIEVLGEKYTSSAETAGTNVRNILITLQKEWAKSNTGPFNFGQALDQLGPQVNDITALTELFGKENVVAAQTLLQNRDRVAELKGEIEGYAGAQELANEAQRTLDGQLDILSAKWDALWSSVSDGDGVLTSIVGGFNIMIDKIGVAYADVKRFFGVQSQLQADFNAQLNKEDEGRKKKAQEVLAQFSSKDATGKLVTDFAAANAKLSELKENYKTLQRGSDAYRRNSAIILEIQSAINARSEEEAQAQKRKAEAEAAAAKSHDNATRTSSSIKSSAHEKELRELEKIEQVRKRIAAEIADSNRVVQEGRANDDQKKTTPTTLTPGGGVPQEIQNAIATANALKEIEREKNAAILQMGLDTYDALGQYAFDLANVGLQNRTKQEIDALEQKKAAGLISEEQYQAQRLTIERKAFEKKKKLDTLEAIINGAVAITKTFAQLGFPAGIPAAALVGAQTLLQLALIRKQKFEKGGMVFGPRHSGGGVAAELEGGEYVISRKGVNRMTLPLLDAINNGLMPAINFANRAHSLVMERGGLVPQPVAAGGTTDNTAMVMEIRAMRMEISTWQREFRVNQSYQDVEDFDDRIKNVRRIADV